jgi:uncharacterized membrane protein YraQ (UPF0718 family)
MLRNKFLKLKKTATGKSGILFLAAIVLLYGILFLTMPEKAAPALRSSANIFRSILIPLCLVFAVLFSVNLFLKPARVARYLGKEAGIRSMLLSAAAGIISTGPIYAWYPLLGDLRRKGACSSPIAVFLYNRAIKPFLLPVMIGYFGWMFSVILTVCMLCGSFILGYAMNVFDGRTGDPPFSPNDSYKRSGW